MDEFIIVKVDFEYFYDKFYEDRKKVRVLGFFIVESFFFYWVLIVGIDDELVDFIG